MISPAARMAAHLKGRNVPELACLAKITPRQAANAIKGRPVATIPFMRLAVAAGFDPMPDLPHAPTAISDFDFDVLAIAFRIKRDINQHTERAAAKASGLSLASISRIENAHFVSVQVVITACRYLGVHVFGYLTAAPYPPISRVPPTETSLGARDWGRYE